VGIDIGGVSGHEQQPDVRIKSGDFCRQVPAVHFRHDHVIHEQVDGTGTGIVIFT
jgi:hypothetical protein